MKYIDAEKLKAEIDRQKIGYNTDGKHTAEYNTCRKILDIIASLQQEQLECIEKTARISPGMLSNFGTSTYVLDVDLNQDEIVKVAPFGFNSGKIKIKIVCE